MLKVEFKKVNGSTLSTYKKVSRMSLDELIATKELLEYENSCEVDTYVVTDIEN